MQIGNPCAPQWKKVYRFCRSERMRRPAAPLCPPRSNAVRGDSVFRHLCTRNNRTRSGSSRRPRTVACLTRGLLPEGEKRGVTCGLSLVALCRRVTGNIHQFSIKPVIIVRHLIAVSKKVKMQVGQS